MQQMREHQAQEQSCDQQQRSAETEHDTGYGTLSQLPFDLPPCQLELLLDEVMKVAEYAAHQRRSGSLRQIVDVD